MNFYSLERIAQGYLRDREREAMRLHMAHAARALRPSARRLEWRQFAALLGWWLRITGLLVRHLANPARANAKLAAIGLPTLTVAQARGTGGIRHVRG